MLIDNFSFLLSESLVEFKIEIESRLYCIDKYDDDCIMKKTEGFKDIGIRRLVLVVSVQLLCGLN